MARRGTKFVVLRFGYQPNPRDISNGHPSEVIHMQPSSTHAKPSSLLSARGKAQLAQSSDRIEAINKMARIVQSSELSLLNHGIEFGKELCQYKREVGHGNWQPLFTGGVFEFHIRTAQRYMRLYRRYEELRHHDHGPKKLTMTKALEALAEPLRLPEHDDEGNRSPDAKRRDVNEDNPTVSAARVSAGRASDFVEARPSTEAATQLVSAASSPPARSTVGSAASSNDEDWLTPDYIVGPLIELLGEIDLDPAADAGKNIRAKMHYTADDDGLDSNRPWAGKVFLNPPSDEARASQFVNRLVAEHKQGSVEEALVLLKAKTAAPWFRQLRSHLRSFLAKPEFASYPGVPDALVAVYLGSRVDRFCQIFGGIGDVYTLYRPAEAE